LRWLATDERRPALSLPRLDGHPRKVAVHQHHPEV